MARELPKRTYGKTGVQMPILALGGAGVLQDASRKQVIRTAMERFPFDMVLFPLNPTEPHHPRTFAKEFLEYARRKGVGLAVMKVMGVGRLVGEGKFTVSELFRYALSHPIHTAVILPNSLRELRELLAAARAFTPLTLDELRALEARAKPLTDQVAGMYHQWP
jgi:predicted aldo/keto reductase-like oxidoreductase